MTSSGLPFYDFFAGGGMASLGLGNRWRCTLANDICPTKAASYAANFPPADEYLCRDVAQLSLTDLPGAPQLVWASFPCQDLSLAGDRRGLGGERSGTFWPFWRLVRGMAAEGRQPPLVVLENVVGALTSHGGHDFVAIADALVREGYFIGAFVVNAAMFVPQSRPRLFVLGSSAEPGFLSRSTSHMPNPLWHIGAVRRAYEQLPEHVNTRWVWWDLPKPPKRTTTIADFVQEEPVGVSWHTKAETARLLELMNDVHLQKVREAQALGQPTVGTVYRRTRRDANGNRIQRAEVRFDGVSGCLRTPAGGSSRETVILVHGPSVRTRLLAPREAASLMGVPSSYSLPPKYNDAYRLLGDGLAVPVVSWIEKHLLHPLSQGAVARRLAEVNTTND